MGAACGKTPPKKCHRLSNELIAQHITSLWSFKILILGSGESGKSTVIKQIRLGKKADPFTNSELVEFKTSLLENVVDCTKAFCGAIKASGMAFDSADDTATAMKFLTGSANDPPEIDADLARRVTLLWKSNAVAEVMKKRDTFWILDGVEWYMDNIQRFIADNFVPTVEDCMLARSRTTGVIMTEFDQANPVSNNECKIPIHWQVVDVGGQRNERRKWIHQFDNVKAVLYVVNLAGYNTVLYEDSKQNRMQEDMELFWTTLATPTFAKTPIFLFLTKKDLLEQKLKTYPLKTYFSDYKGDNSVNSAMAFIAGKFRSKMPARAGEAGADESSVLRVSMVNAHSKDDVLRAFDEMTASIVDRNLIKIMTETGHLTKTATPAI